MSDRAADAIREYLAQFGVRCQHQPFMVGSGPRTCPRWATNAYQEMSFRCDEHRVGTHSDLPGAVLVRALEGRE